MSTEHAPLRMLRATFGSDITRVMGDEPERADVRTATYGDVRLVADSQGCMARVGAGDFGRGDTMQAALSAAIDCRVNLNRDQIRRMERQTVALNSLRIPEDA